MCSDWLSVRGGVVYVVVSLSFAGFGFLKAMGLCWFVAQLSDFLVVYTPVVSRGFFKPWSTGVVAP